MFDRPPKLEWVPLLDPDRSGSVEDMLYQELFTLRPDESVVSIVSVDGQNTERHVCRWRRGDEDLWADASHPVGGGWSTCGPRVAAFDEDTIRVVGPQEDWNVELEEQWVASLALSQDDLWVALLAEGSDTVLLARFTAGRSEPECSRRIENSPHLHYDPRHQVLALVDFGRTRTEVAWVDPMSFAPVQVLELDTPGPSADIRPVHNADGSELWLPGPSVSRIASGGGRVGSVDVPAQMGCAAAPDSERMAALDADGILRVVDLGGQLLAEFDTRMLARANPTPRPWPPSRADTTPPSAVDDARDRGVHLEWGPKGLRVLTERGRLWTWQSPQRERQSLDVQLSLPGLAAAEKASTGTG